MKNTSAAGTTDRKPILFLDGNCVFCQRSAQLLHWLDRHDRIRFAPLQGETAKMLPEKWRLTDNKNTTQPSSAILVESPKGKTSPLRGADAVLRALKLAGGIGSVFWLFHYLPAWLKNGTYQFIARHRYRIAGKQATCNMPDKHFLDKMLP